MQTEKNLWNFTSRSPKSTVPGLPQECEGIGRLSTAPVEPVPSKFVTDEWSSNEAFFDRFVFKAVLFLFAKPAFRAFVLKIHKISDSTGEPCLSPGVDLQTRSQSGAVFSGLPWPEIVRFLAPAFKPSNFFPSRLNSSSI